MGRVLEPLVKPGRGDYKRGAAGIGGAQRNERAGWMTRGRGPEFRKRGVPRLTLLAAVLPLVLLPAACGGKRGPGEPKISAAHLGVNAYLWRASLDTLAFMPLIEADGRAGVIVTDWYSDPAAPDERLKVSVFILSRELRGDAVEVHVVRQTRNEAGIWVNQPVQAATELKIAEAILARARQLRMERPKG
ncbi:MAG: hypothetical protein KatS3mg119_0311 [Rhodothalassiaceae bacterium]|nr:MAG: hypothetical protein KatS3mg119_0311 [Rhodothalassiaceae bacterium]